MGAHRPLAPHLLEPPLERAGAHPEITRDPLDGGASPQIARTMARRTSNDARRIDWEGVVTPDRANGETRPRTNRSHRRYSHAAGTALDTPSSPLGRSPAECRHNNRGHL